MARRARLACSREELRADGDHLRIAQDGGVAFDEAVHAAFILHCFQSRNFHERLSCRGCAAASHGRGCIQPARQQLVNKQRIF